MEIFVESKVEGLDSKFEVARLFWQFFSGHVLFGMDALYMMRSSIVVEGCYSVIILEASFWC